MMNEKLFARVKKVYEQRDKLKLTTEQATLLEETYQGFVRNGVNLNKADKKRYAEISEELSKLSLQFNKNCLADNNSFFLHVTQKEELSGLPESAIAAAHEEAINRKMEGWVFTLDYPSYGPFMSYADNRDLRQKMWTAYNSQCNHGDTNDNNEIIRKITLLRFQQAQLLGYKNYCQYRLSDLMMETPEKLAKFMQEVMQAAYPVAVTDVKEVEHFAFEMDAKKLSDGIQRWDFGYYSEKLKQKKYDFDAELLRPYFQLEKVREGIFNLYGKLYGITFKENPGYGVGGFLVGTGAIALLMDVISLIISISTLASNPGKKAEEYHKKAEEWKLKVKQVASVPQESENQTICEATMNVAYTIGNDLFVANGDKQIQITKNAEHVVAGQSVHRNEFAIEGGIFWSPDGSQLAYYSMDESMVTDYPLVDIRRLRT